MVRLDVWGLGAQTGSRFGDMGYRINTGCSLTRTNTEELRLGRLTFALYTESGSRMFRVETLRKAWMYWTPLVSCPSSRFILEFHIIDSREARLPLPLPLPLALFVFHSSTPFQRQLLPIDLIFGTAERKKKCFNCEIKVKRELKEGDRKVWGWCVWCLKTQEQAGGRSQTWRTGPVVRPRRSGWHTDQARGRRMSMNNAMISRYRSVSSIWLLATSGRGLREAKRPLALVWFLKSRGWICPPTFQM